MAEALHTSAAVLFATALVMPLAILVVAGLVTWRMRRGAPPGRAWVLAGAEVGMVVGTLPWIWMILTPRGGARGVELRPGPGLVQILTGAPGTAAVQVGGNLLVFAAFGFLAPLRWPLGAGAVAGIAALGSTIVEVMQYVLDLGRVTSADDLVLNTLGAVLAALASRRWWRSRMNC